MRNLWILLTLASLEAKEVFYHTFNGTVLTDEQISQQTTENTTFWCSIGIEQPCDPNEFRRLDGSCNNLQHPTIGATHTPSVRLLSPQYGKDFEPTLAQSGAQKPSCRHIRTTLLTTGVRPDSVFTQLASHFFVFFVSDVTSSHDTINYVFWKPYCCLAEGKTDPDCIPIQVPSDDPVHMFSDIRCLNLTRPITYQSTGCLMKGTTPERIVTMLPLFDLSAIYGSTNATTLNSRQFKGGLLKVDLRNGRTYPPSAQNLSDECWTSTPPQECFKTPTTGINPTLGINIFQIWFWRNHNRIATALAELNTCWNDEKLFYTARDINIATLLQIIYYEFFPLLLGWDNLKNASVVSEDLGFRDNYNSSVLPQLTMEFPYILRWAHLMQEGRIKMYDQDGSYLKQVPLSNLTLGTFYLVLDNNIDYITQGSFRQAGGKLDYAIDPGVANRILGDHQRASDVASSDLKKGRYSGFPPYIDYLKHCSGKTINDFEDLADFISADKLELLRDLYPSVKDIDVLAGTWVENPKDGGYAPPTFYCIVVDQLIRSMVSDRHWYERSNRPHAFTLKQLQEVRKVSISRVLCDVADNVTSIQKRGFERSGTKNQMFSCDQIDKLDLTAWKDDTCT